MKTIVSIIALTFMLGVGIQSAHASAVSCATEKASLETEKNSGQMSLQACESQKAALQESYEELQKYTEELEQKIECYKKCGFLFEQCLLQCMMTKDYQAKSNILPSHSHGGQSKSAAPGRE